MTVCIRNALVCSQKMDKMKASDKLSFPLVLDMPSLLASVAPEHGQGVAACGPGGAPPSEYELAAVLIHKGNSASHGHYGEVDTGKGAVCSCLDSGCVQNALDTRD